MAGTQRMPPSPTNGDNPQQHGGRKRPAQGDDDEPLTLTTLLAALKENREEIVVKVREDIDVLTTRVSTVELTVDTHVSNTTKLLEAMTDRHCAMEQSVRQVDSTQQAVLERLAALEGKFAKANFSLSSTRTSESDGGNPRPALVVGGWDADQHHEDTLRLAKQHLQDLNVNLDVSQAFVPGLRRGFALVPLTKLDGESDEEQRVRIQEILRTIRAAKVVTGQRPEGGNRYFFAALSQSPERRKKAQLAGKVKRLIIEEGGDVRRIDVEYGTANLWYNGTKVASGVTSAPEGASTEKAGWVHLGALARQIGISEDAAQRNDLRQLEAILAPKPHDRLHVMSWNVGGLTAAKALEVVSALRQARIRPFCESVIVFMQEIICDTGKHHASLDELQMIFGKRAEDWRGNAVKACSAKGESMLEWFEEQQCHMPPQELEKPTHFPYNTALEPRRLDYIFVKKLLCDPGEVLAHRDIATSDHEPVTVPLTEMHFKAPTTGKEAVPWSSRILRTTGEVDSALDRHLKTGGDPVLLIQKVAVAITKPGKHKEPFKESTDLKKLRRQALHAEPGGERRRLWKDARKMYQREHRQWRLLAMQRVAELDWGMKKALVEQARDHSWELSLTEHDSWKKDLREHFEKIFCRQKAMLVSTAIGGIMHRLAFLCKHKTWRPFDMGELCLVKAKWKNGKSCGPDRVSHEALKAMLPHAVWGERLLAVFNDMLYTCRIVESVEVGATILLAKTSQPQDWSETRPITLSSVLLKSFSQLLLQRAGDAIQSPARLQWCRRGRQGVELILILRRLARIARDWGLEFYIAKLDIRKAFDSIYQESLAEHVCKTVGEAADLPWEARAWVALLHAQNINVEIAGESIPIQQSNGVRQGAPESPVAFGAVVAADLGAAIGEAKASKPVGDDSPPEDGGSYMDDNYIWSTSRKHFQHMLTSLANKLPRRGLFLHPGKTDIVSTIDKSVTFEVAGESVATKEPKHIFHVLGSPLSFQGGTAMLLAEAQSRARKAFWTHRESFTSEASFKKKLLIHVVLVRQSALWACQSWPCHSSLLRGINSIQLSQVRVMLGLRRQPCEEWATWNKRSLRRSRLALYHCGGTRWSTFVLSQIWTAIGHLCRGDPIGGKIFQWHSLQWWQDQKDRGVHVQHAQRFNAYMDIDRQLSETIGRNWFSIAQDRETWGKWNPPSSRDTTSHGAVASKEA
ncbi:unnamed protein product [Symbiodinium sp. CCMP2592]|nr:unnamed protein product [Symbiodinium sp. CCMP2592]